MPLTIPVSGIYNSPEASPLPGITLEFETLYNSTQTQTGTTISILTGEDGSYAVELVPNSYRVCERDAVGWKKELGCIQIFADSPAGTLNEYLTAFRPDQAQPDMLAEMEEILEETKQAAANAGVTPRGGYSDDEQYAVNDLVEYDGSEYLATAVTAGISPPALPWELFVSAGKPNVLKIGVVNTLPAGEPASASITGDSPNQTLNLSLPEGERGEPGPANTLSIGTVETLPPGSESTVVITGDAPNQILSFGLVQGDKGEAAEPPPVLSVNQKTGDVVLDSEDIFSTSGRIGDAEDLNSYITPGLYVQEELGWATNGINYPEPQPGALTVIDTGNGNIIQTYVNYYSTKTYKRAFRNNIWTVWYAVYDEYNKPPTQSTPAMGQPGATGLFMIASTTITSLNPGGTVAGNRLQYAGINDGTGLVQSYSRITPAGTWEIRGYFYPTPSGSHCVSLFMRVDGTNLMNLQLAPQSTRLLRASKPVRNCRYAAPDNSLIECEVQSGDQWYPFAASPNDCTEWGREIYNAAVAGQFGDVAPYQAPE